MSDGADESRSLAPGFGWFWASDGFSMASMQLGMFLIPSVAAVVLRAPAATVGAIYVAQTIPYAVVSPVAGALVDRLGARRVIVAAHALRLIAATGLFFFSRDGALAWWSLAAFALTLGVGNATFDVAYQAAIPALVPADRLTLANSRLQTTGSVAAIVAQPAAGILLERGGAGIAFLGMIALVVASLALLAPVLARLDHRAGARGSHSLREAAGFIRSNPPLMRLFAVTSIANLGIALAAPAALLFYYRTLGLRPDAVGALAAFALGGSLAAGMLAPRLLRRHGLQRALVATSFTNAFGFLVLPLLAATSAVTAFTGSAALALLRGMATTAYNVAQFSFRQQLVPLQMQGRVTGLARMLTWGTVPIGSALSAVLLARFGIVAGIVAAGCVLAAAGIVACFAGARAPDEVSSSAHVPDPSKART
ncbi:MAG: major facilitator superfamily 1 [Candidatus Eremiobacteraeota bacterium]|nr:major facilitator superfamily 1 [Candidatus Eremiobacteraeota bacterium]